MGILRRAPHNQLMTLSGDGTGTSNQASNYSVGETLFYAECPVGFEFVVTHIHAVLIASQNMLVTDFGNIAGGLINGITWETRINGVIEERLGGFRIKTNGDYLAFTDIELTNFSGTAQALKAEFTFPEKYTESVRLQPGDYIGVRLRDDLSSLVKKYVSVWGRLEWWE